MNIGMCPLGTSSVCFFYLSLYKLVLLSSIISHFGNLWFCGIQTKQNFVVLPDYETLLCNRVWVVLFGTLKSVCLSELHGYLKRLLFKH